MKFFGFAIILGILLNSQAHALKLRQKQHPLVSKKDTKLEKKNFKSQLKKEKEREQAARLEWKKMSDFSKAQSPWSKWYRKKMVPALLELSKLRKALYKDNIHDSYINRPKSNNIICGNFHKENRSINGTCYSEKDKLEGAQWTRFSRNISHEFSKVDTKNLLYPNPRVISNELLKRDSFKAVPFLNLLAVGWIQFMTHDWFSHGDNENPQFLEPFYLPLEANDLLGKVMMIPRSMKDYTRVEEDRKLGTKTFLNEVTHWWDGSQVYGSDLKTANKLRVFKNGLLKIDENGLLPVQSNNVEVTGFNKNWWLGLSVLHNLFSLEHNVIAKKLLANHKSKLSKMSESQKDEWLYHKTRMINAALIAKIHTIEWTPAILPNRTLRTAMGANWKGLLNGSYRAQPWYEFMKHDVLFGVVGGKKIDAGRAFHMTEEFVSVYRMHPLLPDNLSIKDAKSKKEVSSYKLGEVREGHARPILEKFGLSNVLYSFGQMHPGQLVLNNYPEELRNINIPFADNVDLASIDILRDRERGLPRYNEFRRQLKLTPLKSFDQLTSDKEVVNKLKKVYNNDIEMLDLMVGCLAEGYRPTGYGFGETAFQVFIIMASRRLMADPFYTDKYNAKAYTQTGLNHIDNNSMKTVLLRHAPELRKSLYGIRNAFNPWNK